MQVQFTFESEACPDCGAQLLRECGRCEKPIFFPLSDRCEFCGLPQPWAPERMSMSRRTRGRDWGYFDPLSDAPTEQDGRITAGLVPLSDVHGTLWVIEGDVTEFKVDAVVSDDDVEGRMWTQVASAIKRAAGDEVERRSQSGRPYRIGTAWATHAGELADVQKIIHVALMDANGQTNVDYVAKCVMSALEKATDTGLRSIALAMIGAAPYAVKREDWLPRVAAVIVDFLRRPRGKRGPPLAILVVLFRPKSFREEFELFATAARQAAEGHSRPCVAQAAQVSRASIEGRLNPRA